MKELCPARWRRIIPIVFFTYSLAYLDRVNYGFAAAGDMARDLGITSKLSSLAGASFFLAYFVFQIPGTIYAERRSVKKLIFWCLLAWGGLAVLTGLASRVEGILVARFLLGIAEAAVLPALLVLLSHWFTRAERSRANTFLILGNPLTIVWMSVLSGYLVHGLGWRWMFVLEGIPAFAWAMLWWIGIDDFPAQAPWLKEEDKRAVEAALAAEQLGLPPMRNYREAFRSPAVICLAALYFCWSAGLYGFVLWLPSILRQASQMGMVGTGWLTALPYLLAAAGMLAASSWSDATLRRRPFVWPFLLLAGLAFGGSFLLGATHFWLSYALLVVAGIGMYAPYGPFFAIIPEILPRNVAGGAAAAINSLGALGGFVGAYFVGYLNGRVGDPSASYLLMSAALLAAAALTWLLPAAPRPTAGLGSTA